MRGGRVGLGTQARGPRGADGTPEGQGRWVGCLRAPSLPDQTVGLGPWPWRTKWGRGLRPSCQNGAKLLPGSEGPAGAAKWESQTHP